MVSEHLLPRLFQKQHIFIGFYQVYRIKKELTPISSISLALSSSSPEINSPRIIKSSTTASIKSDTTEASISSKISSSSIDNTLSMIPTPWTTESWSDESINETIETYSGTVMNTMALTSLTLNPESSTSIGGVTSELNSTSINTVTLLERNEPKSSISVNLNSVTSLKSTSKSKLKVKTKAKSYSEIESTFDSWTVESFTSFVEYSDSKIVKIRYPWSPCTYLSGTDIYPDSMDTFRSSVNSLINSPTLNSTYGTFRYNESDL
ncbi:uncharacterized protein LOC123874711 isoform X2 [Maniola jurtina]|uniref:uncharacterized protein LOC123874711 isoform X2 n=1 Tax=Maniola jurtina TaxID=191418 RepID=UPI001E68A725|nr:uncharacterized protein LOC123874711 isoform X2 [Maniola jurtina]